MHQFYFGTAKSNLHIGTKIVESIDELIPDEPFEENAHDILKPYGTIPWVKTETQLQDWNLEVDPIDFRKMSTPDTTFCLVMAYDSKYPDNCPLNALTAMVDIFKGFSDHVEQYSNTDATAAVFLQKLKEGVQYHNFYFYEFSHGANYYISLKGGVTRDKFWEAIQDAHNRFIGIFDSCDSGSMLNPAEPTLKASPKMMSTQVPDEKSETFFEFIVRKFQEKKTNRARLMSASPEYNEPMFQLWSATEENHYGWYYPKNSTVFANSMKSANNTYKDSRLEVMWTKIKALGSYNSHLDVDNINRAIPQRVCYGEDFDRNITWI